jgi:hypothetical protein
MPNSTRRRTAGVGVAVTAPVRSPTPPKHGALLALLSAKLGVVRETVLLLARPTLAAAPAFRADSPLPFPRSLGIASEDDAKIRGPYLLAGQRWENGVLSGGVIDERVHELRRRRLERIGGDEFLHAGGCRAP